MFSLTCGIFPLKIYNWNVNQGFLGGGYQQERGKEMVRHDEHASRTLCTCLKIE
jgi:hypothetical protein